MMALTSVFMIIEGNQVYWTQLLWIGFVIFGLREIRMEHMKKNSYGPNQLS